MMKTVIMAGGRGSRISALFPGIPKPLIPIDGVPVLERELCSLRDQGFTDIIITVSYLADEIINYFGNGKSWGIQIEYYEEETPQGNAGSLFRLGLTDDFLLINADAVFDIDFKRLVTYHKAKGALATLFTHPNSHPYDSGLLIANDDNVVMEWLTKEDNRPWWYQNRVNAGIHVINPLALQGIFPKVIGEDKYGKIYKADLDRDILKPLCGTGQMFCYDSPEYVKDMGTPERYEQVCRDYAAGIVEARNLRKPQKAVFLDRDGTINKYVGFLRDIDDFELLPGAAEAIRSINESGYLAIVVTNQPVIARGEVTQEELTEIHNKMETLLGKEGAYLDGFFVCPHHPDKGFPGEIAELKIDCDCRKPKPGLLLQAAKEFNIDLSQSWMVGDSASDVQAGKNAGCHTALIGTEECGQEMTVDSLLDFTSRLWKKD